MCDCQPCFTTFSLLEILVIASMGVGIIAAAYKVVFIMEKRHKLSVEKKKVKENKKRLELEAEIAARYRQSVGHVETIELAAEPAKPNHPDVVPIAERNRFTYEPQT